MSSHHFVKEGQEPALCILDHVSFDAAKGLLEWAPKILVVDTALEAILSWGIKVDIVLLESGSSRDVIAFAETVQPIETIQYPSRQDIVSTALKYLQQQDQNDVNLMVSNASQCLPLIASFTASMSIALFEGQSKWTFHLKNYRKWVPKDTSFHIFATQKEQQVGVSGLLKNESGYIAEMDGVVSFNSETPFWVVEDKIF